MNKHILHNHKYQRGQGMVEFALIGSIFMLLLVIIFDFGRAAFIYSSVHNAAREGARYGIIFPDDVSGIDAAARRLTTGLDATQLSVSRTFPNADTIRVTVTYTFRTATPVMGLFTGGPTTGMTVTSSAAMQIEN